MSGRIGALAIRPSNGQFILGGAEGGIWLYDARTGVWTPKTDNLPSLAIGALAIVPSDDSIVYAGTGEGALSGDSYFGNGILKSTDGGTTWSHVSGDTSKASRQRASLSTRATRTTCTPRLRAAAAARTA